MIEKLSRTRRNLALALVGLVVAWFAWTIRSVLNPVLLGYLCAFILAPIVRAVEKRGRSWRSAVNVTFAGGFLLAIVVSLLLVLQTAMIGKRILEETRREAPTVAVTAAGSESTQAAGPEDAGTAEEPAAEDPVPVTETTAIGENPRLDLPDVPPAVLQRSRLELRVQSKVDQVLASLGDLAPVEGVRVDLADLRRTAVGLLSSEGSKEVGRSALDFARSLVQRLAGLAGLFLLLPLYTYYFLFVSRDVESFLQRYLPKRERGRITRVTKEIGQIVANFFRGRLSICFLKGLVLSIGLWIAGIEFAFLFGMLAGFLSIVPFFGPFLGFLLAFLSGVLFEEQHALLPALVKTGVVFGAGELIEGYYLVPKVLGDSLGLHPLVVFVALLAGGAALGTLGVIVALPLTASLVTLFREFVLPALKDWADEGPEPEAPASGG